MRDDGADAPTRGSATVAGESARAGAGPDRLVEPPEFSGEVADHHRRIDETRHDDIYVVGDVHGCLSELETLWDRVDPGNDDLVVFVGDLVRKGPASVEVVEFVRSHANAVSVRGNNEAKILRGEVDPEPFERVHDALASFPVVVSWDGAMAVHSGVDPRRPFRDHAVDDLLETRTIPPGNGYDGPFWFDRYDGPVRVFFGHTVLDAPLVGEHAVGLDTGCVYGGELTAYDYRRDELVSVPSEHTYQERSDGQVLQV